MSRPVKKFVPGENVQPLLLALVEYDDEPGVTLAVVGDNGKEHDCGCIATVSERGLELIAGLNSDLGLPLDERGRIKLVDPKLAGAVSNLSKRSDARKELAKLIARIGPIITNARCPRPFSSLNTAARKSRSANSNGSLTFFCNPTRTTPMLKIAAFEDYHDDRPVLLKLVSHDSEVDLDVVNEHGDPHPKGKLLAIRESGLYLYPSVCPNIGLPVDSEGRLKVFNPTPPAELMALLAPLAEYIAARDKQGYDESNGFTPLSSFEGLKLTMGQMRALAGYYEKHK